MRANVEEKQDEDKFNILGMMISRDGSTGEKVPHGVLEGRKVWGTMAKFRKENVISREVKRELYEGL